MIPDGKVKLYLTKSVPAINLPPVQQVPVVLAQQTSSTSSTTLSQQNPVKVS